MLHIYLKLRYAQNWVETRTAISRVKDLCLFDQCFQPLLLSVQLYHSLYSLAEFLLCCLIQLPWLIGRLTINVTTV